MNGPQRHYRNDPVLKEVMRKHHLQWYDFVSRGDNSYYLPYSNHIRPNILFDFYQVNQILSIDWKINNRKIEYSRDHDITRVVVHDVTLPDAYLATLAGKSANVVVDMPGFDHLNIISAHVKKVLHVNRDDYGNLELDISLMEIADAYP